MKILIEWPRSSTYSSTSYPGGVEKWTAYIFWLFREAGIDVTLLVPKDSETGDGIIAGPLNSRPYDKHQFEPYDFKLFYTTLEDLSDKYDRILLTSMLSSRKLLRFPKLCSKVVFVQHYYEYCQQNCVSFSSWFNQMFIMQQGGMCLTPNLWVEEEGNFRFQKRLRDPECISRLPKDLRPTLEPMFDKSLYNGKLDIIHHLTDTAPLKVVNPKKVVFVGRSVKQKGIVDAARTMAILDGMGYECHIYTRKEGLTFETVEKAYETLDSTGVQVHTMNPHSEIMEALSDTNIMLWTTKLDTVGLVGYEGGVHGCRVIYSITPPDEHMLPSGCAFKKIWKSPLELAEIVKEVETIEFNREKSASYFRDKYTPEKDLQRLLSVL